MMCWLHEGEIEGTSPLDRGSGAGWRGNASVDIGIATDNAGNEESPAHTFEVKIDKSAPTLDTVAPANKQTGVSRDIQPRATFSDEMNPTSLPDSIKLYQWNAKKRVWQKVAVAVDVAGNEATLDPYPSDPSRQLAANKKYKVTVSTGAKNLADLSMPSLRSWTFMTGGA